MKHVLIVLALLCSLCLHAKDGKIKYGKTVVYNGQIEDKQPKGQGVLSLFGHDKKAYLIIEGSFNGTNITDAKVSGITKYDYTKSKEENKVKVRSVNVIYSDDKNKNYHDIQIMFNNLEYALSRNIILNIDSLVLHCTNKPDSKYYMSYMNDIVIGYTRSGDFRSVCMSKNEIDILHTLRYDENLLDRYELTRKIERDKHYLYPGSSIIGGEITSVMKDGTRFNYNTITYPNGDKIEILYDANRWNGWTGTRNFSDGVKISSQKINDSYIIKVVNPKKNSTYTGTLKDIFAPLYPKSTYAFDTGTQIINGVTTKWIKGETFEARHERLKGKLEPKWLAMVEEGTLSEEVALIKQRDEIAQKKREEEDKKRKEYLKKHPEEQVRYHERGRLEKCWVCQGKGLASGWMGYISTCSICGGDGYVIEHYW